MLRTIRRLLTLIALAFPVLALSQGQAFTNRDTELKERAEASAPTLASLPENTAVNVLARAGAWTRVEALGKAGFVRVFHLRFPATVEPSSGGSNALSSLGGFLTGQKSDVHANLATTGVRGLSREDVKNANPDPDALRKMQSYRVDKSGAERFAREGRLAEARVEDPERKTANGGGR